LSNASCRACATGANRQAGGTDYLALLAPSGDIETAKARQDGVIISWVSDRPSGLTDGEAEVFERLQLRLAVSFKMATREETAANVVAVHLGADASTAISSSATARRLSRHLVRPPARLDGTG
jgi:hypothetical protein